MATAIVQEASGSGSGGATFASPVTIGNIVVVCTAVRDGSGSIGKIELGTGGTVDTSFTEISSQTHIGGSGGDYYMGAKVATTSQQAFHAIAYRSSKSDQLYLFEISGATLTGYATKVVTMVEADFTHDPGSFASVPVGDLVLSLIVCDQQNGPNRALTLTGYTSDVTATALNVYLYVAHQAGAGAAMATAFSFADNGYSILDVGAVFLHLPAMAAVSAAFSGTPLTGDAPVTVTFTDASSGTPNQWAWTFGDAGTSTSQNPSHQYVAAGRYTVSLTATRTSDSSTDTVTALYYIIVNGPGVFVDWASDGIFDDTAAGSGSLARMMPSAKALDDEITTDVHSIEWAYGGSSDHVSAASPGWARLTVKNSTGTYNPDNTSSTLYGYLKPGKRIWIGLNADGTITGTGQTVYGIFAGYIREIIPLVEGGATALAEILCEDPLGSYARRPVRVAASTGHSYNTLRQEILADVGEESYSLAAEIDTMPLAAADSDNALSVLEAINQATGSRHWSNPADSKEDWQTYTVVDRHHKLEASADGAINADDVTSISGYRVTSDNIINYVEATVSQAVFPAGIDTVWEYAEATIPVSTTPKIIWATFDDFVKDAVIDYTSTGGTVTTNLTNFGTKAKIEIWAASAALVLNLTIEGRMVVRESDEAVTAQDTASQAAYEKRVGPSISSVYSSTPALAQGVIDFMVWKFGQPMKRPAIEQINEFTAVLPRNLYDVITLTVDRLHVVARRFEIVGISGSIDAAGTAKLTSVTWELQETPNQSALSLFTIDTDALDGAAILGR